MPKIIDHDTHSQDLARRAAAYFSQHGYGGTSMRKIAQHLGLSKSALYHYFPTKEALFLACTRQVIPGEDALPQNATGSETDRLQALKEMMGQDFAAEMALIFDYLRGKSQAEIAQDEAMQLALSAYRGAVAAIVGETRSEQVLAQIMGELMLAYLSGGKAIDRT